MILRELTTNGIRIEETAVVFDEAYDLIVVGLGTAGAISLVTAGREGLKVLGVEQLYGMGGTGTIGAITGYYFGAKGGVYTEIDDKALALEEALFAKGSRRDCIDLTLQREAKACGAQIKYDCVVTGVYMDGNKVLGLRLFQNRNVINVTADKMIDATGEAAICHIAGAESYVGREFDQMTQPFSYISIAVNADGHCGGLNMDAGFVRQQDPRAVSCTIINANNFPMYLKENYSQEEMKFVTTAPLLGVREGRLIKGREAVTFNDIAGLKNKHEEPLFYAFSNVDNHGKDIAFENDELCEWMVVCGLWGVLISVGIPLGALLPEKLENIMVAGRCLAVDHNLAACVRMRRDMMKSGEAAAYVCSEAIRRKIALSEVPYKEIERKLRATKCLNEENNIGYSERVQGEYIGNLLPVMKSPKEVVAWLDSDKPGWGIWTSGILAQKDPEMLPVLKECLHSGQENLSANAALALGLLGEKCALEKLRELAEKPDNYVPASSLKYTYTRGTSAIYLLGKLGDTGAIDILFDVVKRRGRTDLTGFAFSEFYWEDKDVYSQYILFAARALVAIAKEHPEYRETIRIKLLEMLEQPDYKVMITLKKNSESLYDLKDKLVEYIKKQ